MSFVILPHTCSNVPKLLCGLKIWRKINSPNFCCVNLLRVALYPGQLGRKKWFCTLALRLDIIREHVHTQDTRPLSPLCDLDYKVTLHANSYLAGTDTSARFWKSSHQLQGKASSAHTYCNIECLVHAITVRRHGPHGRIRFFAFAFHNFFFVSLGYVSNLVD